MAKPGSPRITPVLASGGGIALGFYGSIFFRTWLVVARAQEPGKSASRDHSLIVLAATEEEAIDKVRRYLLAEGFLVGPIEARFG